MNVLDISSLNIDSGYIPLRIKTPQETPPGNVPPGNIPHI